MIKHWVILKECPPPEKTIAWNKKSADTFLLFTCPKLAAVQWNLTPNEQISNCVFFEQMYRKQSLNHTLTNNKLPKRYNMLPTGCSALHGCSHTELHLIVVSNNKLVYLIFRITAHCSTYSRSNTNTPVISRNFSRPHLYGLGYPRQPFPE